MWIRKIIMIFLTAALVVLIKVSGGGKEFIELSTNRHIPNELGRARLYVTNSTSGYGSITAVSNLVINLQNRGYEVVNENKTDMTIDFALRNKAEKKAVRVAYDWKDNSIFFVSSDYSESMGLVEFMRSK
jgi:hypothetical protein